MDSTVTSLPVPPRARNPLQETGGFKFSLLIAVVLLIAAALNFAGPTWLQSILDATQVSSSSCMPPLVVAYCFSILWHESGHLIAAKLVGFEVTAINLGPVQISRTATDVHCRLQRRNWFAASISAFPRRGASWRTRMLTVIAAGPVMTLFAALISVSVLAQLHPTGVAATFLAFVVELNALLFVLGLLPNPRHARVRNDARLFISVWANAADAEEILRYHLLMQLRHEGFRPRFYPAHLIREFARPCERSDFGFVFASAITECALDMQLFEMADAWDRHALETGTRCAAPWSASAIGQSAFLDIVHRNDYRAAREKVTQISLDLIRPEWLMHRTAALYRLLMWDPCGTVKALQLAESCLRSRRPYAEFQLELISRFRAVAFSSGRLQMNVERTA